MSMTSGDDKPPLSRRQLAADIRRQAILDAGLNVFSRNGFEAARLDDVASEAGVAKGTIYLSFRDKEHLFEEIILGEVTPVLALLDETAAIPDIATDLLLTRLFDVFQTHILQTKRKDIARLIIKEGTRFPKLAEIYHREVIAKVMTIVGRIMQRGIDRGEVVSDAYARFPHLIMAPMLLALIWDGLFSPFAALDAAALLHAHLDLILVRTDQNAAAVLTRTG